MGPESLLFAESHEWVKVEDADGGKVAVIGLSAHAIEALTDLVYMDLPTVGDAIESGGSFGEIESVKATSEMYSPVAGEIVDVNASLPDKLEILNTDPYGEGWIVKIKLANEDGLSQLMDHSAYEKMCSED